MVYQLDDSQAEPVTGLLYGARLSLVLERRKSKAYGSTEARLVKTRIEIPGPVTPGRKSWRKLLTGVDPARPGRYAFLGEWLPTGRTVDLEPGSFMLLFDDAGEPDVFLARLGPDGTWQAVEDSQGQIRAVGPRWVAALRGRVAATIRERE